jgi:hypothetical protein
MEWYYSTITLKPGADWRTEYSLELTDSQSGKVYSGGIDYGREPLYIEAIKMPPIAKSEKPLPESLRGRFPFGIALTNLQLARPDGLSVEERRRECYRRQIRETADNYFNHVYAIALRGMIDPLGSSIRRYKMTVAPVMHITFHNDVDVEKYRKYAADFIRKRYNPAKYRDAIKRNKDIILAYYTGDELQAKNAACMVLGQEILKKEFDQPDGAFFPYLNLGALGDPLVPYLPVNFGDYYPIYHEERKLTRNPWSVYNMVKTAVAKFPDTPVWFMPQYFGGDPKEYIYALPTAAELRIMLYSAVAAGAKGIIGYGANTASPWLAKGGGPARTVISCDGGYYPERWKALGECGRELTAIGPRLLSCSPDFKYTDVKVESPEIRKTTLDVVVYGKPALSLDVLKDRENKFRYLVIVNQDDKKTQEGTLSFSGDAVKQKCYNLTDFSYIDTDKKFKITLRPGDAKFFIIGNGDYIKPEIEQVFTNRFDREKVRFIIAADRAEKNGIKIPAIPKGKGEQAYRQIIAVRQQLQKNIDSSDFGKLMQQWQGTRQTLNKIDLSLRENLGILVPLKIRQNTPPFKRFPKAASSGIHALLNQIDRNFCEYWRLDREIEAGRALKNRQQIADLSARLSQNYRALEKVVSNK